MSRKLVLTGTVVAMAVLATRASFLQCPSSSLTGPEGPDGAGLVQKAERGIPTVKVPKGSRSPALQETSPGLSYLGESAPAKCIVISRIAEGPNEWTVRLARPVVETRAVVALEAGETPWLVAAEGVVWCHPQHHTSGRFICQFKNLASIEMALPEEVSPPTSAVARLHLSEESVAERARFEHPEITEFNRQIAAALDEQEGSRGQLEEFLNQEERLGEKLRFLREENDASLLQPHFLERKISGGTTFYEGVLPGTAMFLEYDSELGIDPVPKGESVAATVSPSGAFTLNPDQFGSLNVSGLFVLRPGEDLRLDLAHMGVGSVRVRAPLTDPGVVVDCVLVEKSSIAPRGSSGQMVRTSRVVERKRNRDDAAPFVFQDVPFGTYVIECFYSAEKNEIVSVVEALTVNAPLEHFVDLHTVRNRLLEIDFAKSIRDESVFEEGAVVPLRLSRSADGQMAPHTTVIPWRPDLGSVKVHGLLPGGYLLACDPAFFRFDPASSRSRIDFVVEERFFLDGSAQVSISPH